MDAPSNALYAAGAYRPS